MADKVQRFKNSPSEQLKDRVPPHNNEAEQSLLGSMIISSEVIAEVTDKISASDFYRPTHQKIFEAITSLYTKGEAVDPITVADELEATGKLEEAGGRAYLHTLINVVPTAANARYYAEIVEKTSIIRSLIHAATDVVNMGYEGIEDIGLLIDEAESRIFSVSKRRISEKFAHIKELLKEGFENLEKLHKRGAPISGLATGLNDLDEKTSGLHPSDLIIIAARPSMGKTSLVLSMAQHIAIEEKTPVAIFSLEMSRQQLAQRLLCSEARVDVQQLRSGKLDAADWTSLSHAAGRLAEAPIYIDDTPSITMMEVRAKARRLMAKHKLGLIIVDYLQLMQSRGRAESRQQEISEISRSLKILGRELDVPVIAVSQLSRAVESRTDKRPLLSDLRECVTGETPVTLADGRRLPIRDLVGTEPEVLAVSDEGKIVYGKSDKVWCVGKRPIFKVTLASGRTIRGTDKHRLLAAGGWQRIRDLKIGDRLAIARRIPEPTVTEEWSDKRVILCDEGLKGKAESDLFWDRIISITPDGEEDVFDLTVPGPASWLADSIVSHNSGAIEQDADLVVFIYRDEYYNRDSDEKGIAEVIISKHRNGPTGTVRLAFLEQYTRFANLARGYD